jgi:DivIVA domain-containing protein
MPLTPQDVHSKVFGPTRFRRGYDETEVDAFLDEVEAELLRLHRELDELRSQVGARTGTDEAALDQDGSQPVIAAPGESPAWTGTTADAAQAAARSAGKGGGEHLEQQVARTLVLAQRAADEAVRDAEQQAEQLRTAAQTEAERIRREAEKQAEQKRSELERTRSAAEDEVEQLKAFEREYRTRLRAYLELQLRELDHSAREVEDRQAPALETSTTVVDETAPPAAADEGSGLLTSPLPQVDPASVPPGTPLGERADEPSSTPRSVPVGDYGPPTGISVESPGEESSHATRDLL